MAATTPYTLLGGTRLYGRSRKTVWIAGTVAALLLCLGATWHVSRNQRPFETKYTVSALSSTITGHAAGFKVLRNVGFHDREFYFFNTSEPDTGAMMTGTTASVVNTTFHPDVYFTGTTMFLNERATGEWSGLWHYYHFAVENVLGGFAALGMAHDGPVMPDRLVIAWDGDWHDKWSMNDRIVETLWDEVVDPKAWSEIRLKTVFFEELVLVDRWAAHRTDPEVEQWIKMPVVVFQDSVDMGRSHFFDTARDKVHAKFGAKAQTGQRIAYIDRQSTDRRLPDAEHEELVAALRRLASEHGAEFDHMLLEKMQPKEQFKRVSEATILVGIHGNGLTHLMWLPSRSAVIELFPKESFLRDYQCATEVLGHHYTAIRGNATYTKADWEAHGGVFGADELHNGTPVDVDVSLVVGAVRAALERQVV